jgi:hypothetical protein
MLPNTELIVAFAAAGTNIRPASKLANTSSLNRLETLPQVDIIALPHPSS